MRIFAFTVLFAIIGLGCAGPTASSAPRSAPAAAVETITVVEAEGRPQLRVAISHPRIETYRGARPMWAYVSDGLAAKGQRELVLLLDDDGKGETPDLRRNVRMFFEAMYRLASSGNSVGVHGMARLPTPLVLGPSTVAGFLFAKARAIPGLSLPRSALVAIPLLPTEADAAENHGRPRVLGRLGYHHREYPYAYWFELGRPAVIDEAMLKTTRLNGEHLFSPWLRLLNVGDRLLLRVVRSERVRGAAALSALDAKRTVVLIPHEDTTADHAFVWVPGSESPVAINATNTTVQRGGFSFLAVIPGDLDRAVFVEDGVGLFLSPTAWDQIRRAIFDGKNTTVAAAGDRPAIEVELVDEELADPDVVLPATTPQTHRLQEILIITPDEELKQRTTPAALVQYLRAIEAVIETAVATRAPGTQLVVEHALDAGRAPEVRVISATPALSQSSSEAVLAALRAVEAPSVSGPVRFRLKLATKPRP